MSYFEDLTPYAYFAGGDGELNIGWLEGDHPFPKGTLPVAFVEGLAWLCVHAMTRGTKGWHICSLCPASGGIDHYGIVLNGKRRNLGTAEIRVQGRNAVYAAPTLILHYVVDHGYAPRTISFAES